MPQSMNNMLYCITTRTLILYQVTLHCSVCVCVCVCVCARARVRGRAGGSVSSSHTKVYSMFDHFESN